MLFMALMIGCFSFSSLVINSNEVKENKNDVYSEILEEEFGRYHSGIAVDTTSNGKSDSIYMWGSNGYGELGVGDNVEKTNPTKVEFDWSGDGTKNYELIDLELGGWHSGVIIDTTGNEEADTLYMWGMNRNGQLGLGNTIARSSPIQVGTSSWTSVSAGAFHTAAILSDGALFTWGINTSGQLGLGDRINKSSPVQVGTSSWTSVSAGASHTAAIRSDGALFTWGNNFYGNLGFNPRQFPASTSLKYVNSPVPVFQIKEKAFQSGKWIN